MEFALLLVEDGTGDVQAHLLLLTVCP